MSSTGSFLIIDGHAMAFRAYYAMASQNLTDSNGNPTETVYGFFRMIIKAISDIQPAYLVIVFDPPEKNFRYKIYEAYKANRSETPEPLKYQISKIQELVHQLELPMIIPNGVEADDAIATLVEKYKSDNFISIKILSGDKDLYALLNSNVTILKPVKGASLFSEITADSLIETQGIKPEQVTDYLALIGDTADNIPGVAGIGPKTAVNLLKEFQTLDNIYSKIESVSSKAIREKLQLNKENAYLSRKLIELNKNVPISQVNKEDFLYNNNEILQKNLPVFNNAGFPTIYNEWIKLFEQTSNTQSYSGQVPIQYTIIYNPEEWRKWDELIKKNRIMAVDTETTGKSPMNCQLVGVSICFLKDGQYNNLYIPLNFDTENQRHFDYQSVAPAEVMTALLKPLLENQEIEKIGQNIKYDYLVLKNHGIVMANILYDTMICSHILDPNNRRHNLDDLSLHYLQHKTIKYKDITGTGKNIKALSELPLNILAEYATEDAEITYRLFNVFLPMLQKENLYNLYLSIDQPMIKVLSEIEENGVKIDNEYLKLLDKNYHAKLEEIEKEIYSLAGKSFNINSTKELQEILFTVLEIKSKKKTPKGSLSTDATVLESIKEQHPIINKILNYRTLHKLLSTYIRTLPEYINPKTGRVHTSISQTVAATGRLSSYDPNLQNIPIKGEDGAAIRKAFVAEKGFELLSLDYNQIELRILADYSKDDNLLYAYKNDIDIHDQATILLFGQDLLGNSLDKSSSIMTIDYDKLTYIKSLPDFKAKRSMAKILNFSIVYGVTEYGLSQNIGISVLEARSLIESYFHTFPGIKKYMVQTIEECRDTLYSTNYFGRKRALPDINHKNRFMREAAERLAINNPIQSTAADLIKKAMIEISNWITQNNIKSKMVLQIHDELLFEVHNSEKELFYEKVKHIMETIVPFIVPLKVSGSFGANWQDTK